MQPETPMMAQPASQTLALTQNRVLRNTYMLLAISMVPTVVGAWLGVKVAFSFFATNPLLAVGLFLGVAFGFFFAINKMKDSVWGVVLLLGFTFFMGLMLAPLLTRTLNFANGGTLIMAAFGGTAAVFATMATLASTIKRDLAPMGKFLFVGVIMLLLASIANIFLQMPGLMIALSLIAIGIFSALLLYDINRIITGGETNYVTATLAVYLDVYNIFANLLSLLGLGGSND